MHPAIEPASDDRKCNKFLGFLGDTLCHGGCVDLNQVSWKRIVPAGLLPVERGTLCLDVTSDPAGVDGGQQVVLRQHPFAFVSWILPDFIVKRLQRSV